MNHSDLILLLHWQCSAGNIVLEILQKPDVLELSGRYSISDLQIIYLNINYFFYKILIHKKNVRN